MLASKRRWRRPHRSRSSVREIMTIDRNASLTIPDPMIDAVRDAPPSGLPPFRGVPALR